MSKQILVVIYAVLALSSAKIFKPRDLVDEAEEQLQELQSIVRGDILVAHDDLNNLGTDFQAYTADVYNNGVIDIQQEYEQVDAQVTTVVDLAHSAGYDVTTCTDIREQVLGRLPSVYGEQLAMCIANINVEREALLRDARYIIDIIINKVETIASQLRMCRGDILCISPLIQVIELNKIELPQHIKTEVQSAEGFLTTLRLSVAQCSDSSISEFTSRASAILGDITACIERIIG